MSYPLMTFNLAFNQFHWRNNQGVNYPYDFGAFASITSSNAGNQYYYFYYDIEMRPSATPSTYELCDGDTFKFTG